MPFLRKESLAGFGINGISKGRLYDSGSTRIFTVIRTGLGTALLGDAALYLAHTPCENIILFGSCGSVDERYLKIGAIAAPFECHSLESFSGMLLRDRKEWKIFHPDKDLFEGFLEANEGRGIQKVSCATLGSLKLEQDYIAIFKERDIRIVDMECSALFSASIHINKKAMALFYVTDIINKKPFYTNLTAEEKIVLSSSIKSSTHILCEFIEKNLSA